MEKTNIKIAIAETGYVGLSNEILLEKHNEVLALDDYAEKFIIMIYLGKEFYGKLNV